MIFRLCNHAFDGHWFVCLLNVQCLQVFLGGWMPRYGSVSMDASSTLWHRCAFPSCHVEDVRSISSAWGLDWTCVTFTRSMHLSSSVLLDWKVFHGGSISHVCRMHSSSGSENSPSMPRGRRRREDDVHPGPLGVQLHTLLCICFGRGASALHLFPSLSRGVSGIVGCVCSSVRGTAILVHFETRVGGFLLSLSLALSPPIDVLGKEGGSGTGGEKERETGA